MISEGRASARPDRGHAEACPLRRSESLLFRLRRSLLDQALVRLPAREDKVIVIPVIPPRAGRNIAHVHELPVSHVGRLETKVITDRG